MLKLNVDSDGDFSTFGQRADRLSPGVVEHTGHMLFGNGVEVEREQFGFGWWFQMCLTFNLEMIDYT